ncbi:deoxyguanosinetriphosphate triphosphohydrolase family protein [Chromohalobacter sp. TMW 2.2308]|uniref:Deoxyguanosinetriphosphate triphosphohydrolase-like protein n=1 Tax=Chromohalobacter moromii TaxID=2860329 RepID=A0A9X2X3Q0_9GAMM|nr:MULTISPECIES: anti-phage deoxyguanosine triphosphatase [Chromohalobacter]MCK2041243.1 deoxyguanosinetriphosphate triphosphohydrolase family protein [Chromohalobacter moromii]MCK2046872.1 deoxyguanosinetriphosphate triphosphohydrolase family protein [Chromohalobacter moromii]MCT8506449.1 deoxyguanosinetriphosphate triphosphohydrolase family protein [Chromohalobacter moromii]MCT8513391.1 deoxyguanosinetriphosphate triphosphohydrolase family protein [Chromohalobacter sp. TMW 2.2271]
MWNERRRYEDGYQRKAFNSFTEDSEAQRDRARIIHSAAFRRLQSKTQVLGIGENDFYRTRLTHSMEVAQIGSGICESLREKHKSQPHYLKFIPTLSQIEAICLCHDIGHPPFGHGGELALNYYMHSQGGFEGNGQTLRITSKLGEYSPKHGIDLTRRTMLGILKYPALHRQVSNYQFIDKISTLNIDNIKPPKCIHDEEIDILEWVLLPFSDTDTKTFLEVKTNNNSHHKSSHKSFDTTIMEYADDIAYGVHDLEDALALGLILKKDWDNMVEENLDRESLIAKEKDFYDAKLFSDSNKERKHAISKLVGHFIKNITITEKTSFSSPMLRYQAEMLDSEERLLGSLKHFIYENVIKKPEVQTLEYKGQQIIIRIFETLQKNPKRLLPTSTYQKYLEAENKNRVICDYISGMTDSYATKLYHKLFSPDVGSIFDRM